MIESYNEQQTAALLPYPKLVDLLSETVADYAAGKIASPERLVIPLEQGGVMLSMPASATDIAIHKLVNVCPANSSLGLPTIHGQVNAYDSVTGQMLFSLDGPTVTGRRTAAVSALAIRHLAVSVKAILLIGTGKQASYHVDALATLFPGAAFYVKGSSPQSAARFAAGHAASVTLAPLASNAIPDEIDVVVTLTTSKTPVYHEAARAERLLVAVGAFTPAMAEIAVPVVNQSAIFVDDPLGAKHEAGDLIQANVSWDAVGALADVIAQSQANLAGRPILFKSVGCAAWDLAAARLARQELA